MSMYRSKELLFHLSRALMSSAEQPTDAAHVAAPLRNECPENSPRMSASRIARDKYLSITVLRGNEGCRGLKVNRGLLRGPGNDSRRTRKAVVGESSSGMPVGRNTSMPFRKVSVLEAGMWMKGVGGSRWT